MWFQHVKNLTLKMENTYLDCARFGNGKKTLILLPGLSFQGVRGAALMLAYMYRVFEKEYTVYVFDKKADIPDGYTIRDMADDVAQAMKRLHLHNADVFGVSQGGMIAQYLAIDHPHLVRKLVLGVTASRCNEVMEKVIHNWIQMAEADDHGAIVTDMFAKMYSDTYVRKYRWMYPVLTRIVRAKDLSRFTVLARTCLTCQSYPELHKIICPVFVVGGRKDHVVTGEASQEIADVLGCEIYLYDDLGHAAYEEAAEFNERILAFLKK